MCDHTDPSTPTQEAQHLSLMQKVAVVFAAIAVIGGYLAMIKLERDGKEQL